MQPLRKAEDWMRRLGDPSVSVSEFELYRMLDDLKRGRVESHPDEHATLRGLALGRLGRHVEALAAFEEVVALGCETWEVTRNRGVALLHLGRLPEAAEAFVRASEQPSGYNLLVLVALIDVLVRSGAFSEARDVFEAAVGLAQTSDEWLTLVRSADALGEPRRVLQMAAKSMGGDDRLDLEAFAREILCEDLPDWLTDSLRGSLNQLGEAREAWAAEAQATRTDPTADASALAVFEAFAPLRERANASVFAHTSGRTPP